MGYVQSKTLIEKVELVNHMSDYENYIYYELSFIIYFDLLLIYYYNL